MTKYLALFILLPGMMYAQPPAVTTIDQLQSEFKSDVQKLDNLKLKLQNITEFQQYLQVEADLQKIQQQAAEIQKKQETKPEKK